MEILLISWMVSVFYDAAALAEELFFDHGADILVADAGRRKFYRFRIAQYRPSLSLGILGTAWVLLIDIVTVNVRCCLCMIWSVRQYFDVYATSISLHPL